jgi:DNA invertase Pin-like site-specific DNA recombinase
MALVDGYVGPSLSQGAAASRASVARWQFQRWTAARGWRVGRILEEASPQASAAPRRLRELAVERVESYETDGIVTTSLRELGDCLTDVIATIERIDAAGGVFVSLHEDFDLTTAPGRYMFRLLVSVVEWERRGALGQLAARHAPGPRDRPVRLDPRGGWGPRSQPDRRPAD